MLDCLAFEMRLVGGMTDNVANFFFYNNSVLVLMRTGGALIGVVSSIGQRTIHRWHDFHLKIAMMTIDGSKLLSWCWDQVWNQLDS